MIDIRSRRPRRVLVRVRHLARDHPRSLRSRARLEMRDQSAAAALSERHTPRQSHDGVMIDILSRRSRRVHVRHLARDHPRSLRSRARLEMRDEDASGRRPTRQHAIAQWLSRQQLCDQPTALEPLVRLSSRATARRARAARRYLESPESISNIPLETARDHQDRGLVSR